MFKAYVKGFMKKIVDHMEKNGKSADQVAEFKKKIQAWVVSLLVKDRFKNLAFFIGKICCCFKVPRACAFIICVTDVSLLKS